MVIGDHFGGGDHFDGGDHFGGGTAPFTKTAAAFFKTTEAPYAKIKAPF